MKLASFNLKVSGFTSSGPWPVLFLDFIGQARLFNIKYNCLGNCPKDFIRNKVYLVQKIKKEGRKEGREGGREERRKS